MKPVLFVSFSGGRTSAYMCWWLIKNKADEYDLRFVYANTGLEHSATIEFVNNVDQWLNLELVWVEAVVNPERGKGTTHKIVTYETAAMNGEPFEAMIKKYGIPNTGYPHCTRETKMSPMFSYKRSLGHSARAPTAIGIRSDEIDRISSDAKRLGLVYPLVQWTNATKEDIRHWWAEQFFDLEIPEHYGNCITCWKKSDRKLMTIAKHEPHYFDFFDRMERVYGNADAGDAKRVFFRKYRSTQDILALSKTPFKEFVDHMPERQLDILNPMDIESGCGAGSCEIE